MNIQILGTGCPKCKQLTALAETAAKELGVEYSLEKITKLEDILSFGVMLTPAIALNGKIVFAGDLPTLEQLKTFFLNLRNKN